MKLGILTHYDVNNQGAQLQLYALYRLLEEMGHVPVVLTYRKNYDFVPSLERRNQITLASVPYLLKNFLFAKGIGLTWHNVRKYRINKKFRLAALRHASYCHADLDAALVGADEVFSLELGANMMMYGHGVNTDKMIAYAPSIGQTDLDRIDRFHCRALMESGLSRFVALSARDRHTQEIVHTLTKREVELVCDPVLLYRFPLDVYSLPKGTPRRPYMVVYSYDARFVASEEITAIRGYARRHGLKTVSVGTYHGWCDVNIACNALEWLKCIQGASCMVTDTFHGTIASVITECPMALTYSKEVNANKMLDLIVRLGLENRRLEAMNTSELERVFSLPVDFSGLRMRVEDFRNHSLAYLTQALSQV